MDREKDDNKDRYNNQLVQFTVVQVGLRPFKKQGHQPWCIKRGYCFKDDASANARAYRSATRPNPGKILKKRS